MTDWIELQPRNGRTTPKGPMVSIGVKAGVRGPRLALFVSANCPGFNAGGRVHVARSADGRQLRLELDPAGAFLLAKSTSKGWAQVMLPPWGGIPNAKTGRMICANLVIADGVATLELPRALAGAPVTSGPAPAPAPPPAKKLLEPEAPEPSGIDVKAYLTRKGCIVVKQSDGRFRVDSELKTTGQLLALVNRYRARSNLPAVIAEDLY